MRGEASLRWSSWKQDNHNATWKNFERGFIKKFIPYLWDMLEVAEDEEQESKDHILNEMTKIRSQDVGDRPVIEEAVRWLT